MKRFMIAVFVVVASWYSSTDACQYNKDPKCPTASGKSLYALEKAGVEFAASWDYPFGTKLEVTNTANGKKTIVTVLDRGPAKRLGRGIDLSKKSAKKLGFLKQGTANVEIEKVVTPDIKKISVMEAGRKRRGVVDIVGYANAQREGGLT